MSPKTCPICQTAIPENAPGGFCPVCLLRGAGAPCLTGREAPPIEEIAAAFPQLEILELIGQGGMGFVYKARQSHLDRTVALKILAPELQRDPSFAERFAREARALGKLRHPNIVTLHEHGENGGFFYLLMEYVDGVNLRQAMAAGRFTPEQALAVVPPICDALQSAHAQGVWHRDIKPENILLDRDGRVKIADFGIARIASDPVCNFTLTFTGHTLGSAAYMAPEQHENPRHVDHRADIYSLGVVIYEMLTGELPLGRFPAPSQRAEVNARIDEIVLRTLEKERELRQQSADEVKSEVTNVGNHASPPRGKNTLPISPASRKRPAAKTIFFLCAGLLALVCGFFFLQATSSKRREEAAYEAMTEELKLKAGIDLGSWEAALLAMKEPGRNYTLGHVIEQTIPKPAKGVPCLLDFESGRLSNPPDTLGEMLSRGDTGFAAPIGSEDGASITRSRFESLSINGIDALATMPDGNSLRLFRSLAFPISESFDKISTDDVLKRVKRGLAQQEGAQLLRDSYLKRAFIPLPAPAGVAFAFISQKPHYGAAVIGVLQITGTQKASEGVNIRYRLIERLPDSSPPAAEHGVKEQLPSAGTGNEWKIDAEKLITAERDGWAPWETHIKEGNMRALQRDWSGASASYLEGLAVAQKKAETVPGWQANVAESNRHVGDAMCAMGDLKSGLRNYQASMAIFEKLLEKAPPDSRLRDQLTETHVRIGDVLKATGDAAGALQSYRDGVAASEKLKKGWETEYPLGRREDALARNYQAAEVLRLIDTPNREPGDLMWMIGQAGAEKDDRLRPLLARKNLREDSTLALSLAGYDYSLNGNQNGLDFILANLSKQQVGADVNEVFVLAFLDEWDRSIKAVNSHFLLLDGAGGDCKNMFWARRMLLFPRNYLVYKGKAGDGAPLPASKAVSENVQDDQAGLPLSLEVRPNDPELLQKRSNAEVIEVGLQDPRSHVIAWNVLRQRAEAGQFSRAEAGELIGKLTSWLRRDYPDGFWDTLWVSSLLQVALERHLISDDETLDFLQAFYAGVHIDPFPRLRAGNTVQMKGELRNVWHDDMLGIRLLNQVTSITVDGKAVGLKHRSNKNGEGQSGWLEDYDTKLLVAGLLPGKHRVRCEIDSALVAVADCGGMEPNDPPAKWPATKRRWQRTHELDLTIYAQDAELVKLSDNPALNPLKPAELSAKPIVIRPGKDGLVAAVSLNSKKSEGVPYSVKVALKLGGKTFPCGSFWFDGKKESGSENSSGRLTFAVDIGALDSGATEAEIVLSPNPKGIEASPGVDRIWGQDIVFEHVPLERLDGTDPTAAIEARLQKKYGPNYLTWSPALEALPNARLIQVASENPAEAGSIWGILKMRLEEEKLGANEANDLMAKLTEWLRRIQPDGYGKQNLIIMEEFLFALHRRHLVLEPQTTAYLRVLHGDGEVTAKNYLHDQIVRFGCGMGGAWHRDVWFGFKLLREFRSVTVDGKPVEVRGSKRRGMMNGAGFPGEFSLADLSPGKHLVRFEVHSALVAEQDAAGLSGDAPTAEWPPARLNWDGNLEAELVIPSEAQNPDGKPNEPVLTPLKTKPQEQTGGGGQPSETGETPEAAMEELLKAAHDRNDQVFVSRLSRSMIEMLKKEGSDPSKNFGDFDRVRLVEAKTTGATTAEVVVQSTDTSTPKQRGTLRMTLEDERWKLSDIGN